MIKLVPPKTVTPSKQFMAVVTPKKGGRGTSYKLSGLRGRKTCEGVYKFELSDGTVLNPRTSIMVEISSPWRNKKVVALSPTCSVHGVCCQYASAGDDCDVVLTLQELNKWMPLVCLKKGFFEVCLHMAKGSKKKVANSVLAFGAGFAVMVIIPV
jgi:hypothetical protein